MEKKIVRAAIAGSGFAAAFHYEALQRVFTAKVDVTGVYSTTPEKREAFAAARNIKPFKNLEALLDGCDVVHVCTPPATHESIVIKALEWGKDVIVEKPFTGYFGDGSETFNGDTFLREEGLNQAVASIKRMLEAEQKSNGNIMYAENWIYAPAIQKEREVLQKTGAQILWMHGEQSHSGSHSVSYGQWRFSGGGSMMGKGCHPVAAALYFKQVEGRTRNGNAIRPKTITARTHVLTRMPAYNNEGYLRATYNDTEDFALLHIEFEDGAIASLFASEVVLGGVNNWIELNTTNHRTRCQMSHNDAMKTYTPDAKHLADVYVVEKGETKEGWSFMSPDEGWFHGYQHEMNAFYKSIADGSPIESNSRLAADTIATIYAGYLSTERNGEAVTIPLL